MLLLAHMQKRLLNRRTGLCRATGDETMGNYLFHAKSNRCYFQGTQGPCGDNMVFEPLFDDTEDVVTGDCRSVDPESHPGRTTLDRCFPIFTQVGQKF